jgi:uncharacterized protein YeaO (DUF488 family)
MIQCKHASTPATHEDGRRILVDRLWPRNCRKDQLPLSEWLPDVAPSPQLHKALAEMVIVRYASHPIASNSANDPVTLPAFEALAQYLSRLP